MSDDALMGLNDSLASIRQQEQETLTGNELVKQQYGKWAKTVALPALKKIQRSLQADGATTKLTEAKGHTPAVGIQVADPGSGQPGFQYMLYLHENTGTERAFVMKLHTVPNRDYGALGREDEDMALREQAMFWNENEGEPYNHAPDITETHIIEDFTREFTAYRQYPWPKPIARQQGPGKSRVPSGFHNQKRGLPPSRG